MKFNKLFAASLALSASAVSAQRQRLGLRGIASSVLLEDSSSSSGSDSGDSNWDSNSQDGLRRDMETWGSADSNADSNSNSSDEPAYYYEDLFATNFYEKDYDDEDMNPPSRSEPEYSSMFIAAGSSNSNSNKGYCTGRGWNTCDNRRPDCRWIGNQRDGYCVDDNRNNNNSGSSGGGGSPFENGLREGQQTAQHLWRNMGNSCSNAWKEFPDAVDREIRNRGWDSSSGNWNVKAFNQGARAGMQQVLKEKEKQCFNVSPDECIDLGNEAARIIAFEHCEIFQHSSHPDFKETCRNVAIGQCQGQIFHEVKKLCGAPSTHKIWELQNKCENKVNSLIGLH